MGGRGSFQNPSSSKNFFSVRVWIFFRKRSGCDPSPNFLRSFSACVWTFSKQGEWGGIKSKQFEEFFCFVLEILMEKGEDDLNPKKIRNLSQSEIRF